MLELYGTKGCPYTRELREALDLDGEAYVEYDVEEDMDALRRMVDLTGGRTVPVLVEDGQVLAVGVQGRGCIVSFPTKAEE